MHSGVKSHNGVPIYRRNAGAMCRGNYSKVKMRTKPMQNYKSKQINKDSPTERMHRFKICKCRMCIEKADREKNDIYMVTALSLFSVILYHRFNTEKIIIN